MPVKNYYEILEISENATQEEIKKTRDELAKKYHPDKFLASSICSKSEREEAEVRMKEINEAYDTLGDEEKRKKYDFSTLEDIEFDYSLVKEWLKSNKEEREAE